jgi:hypothetical protein
MNPSAQKRGSSLGSLPDVKAAAHKMPNPRKEKAPKDPDQKIKASFFLYPETHDRLADLCHRQRLSQQQVFEAALDAWFQAMGEEPMREVIEREKKEKGEA